MSARVFYFLRMADQETLSLCVICLNGKLWYSAGVQMCKRHKSLNLGCACLVIKYFHHWRIITNQLKIHSCFYHWRPEMCVMYCQWAAAQPSTTGRSVDDSYQVVNKHKWQKASCADIVYPTDSWSCSYPCYIMCAHFWPFSVFFVLLLEYLGRKIYDFHWSNLQVSRFETSPV